MFLMPVRDIANIHTVFALEKLTNCLGRFKKKKKNWPELDFTVDVHKGYCDCFSQGPLVCWMNPKEFSWRRWYLNCSKAERSGREKKNRKDKTEYEGQPRHMPRKGTLDVVGCLQGRGEAQREQWEMGLLNGQKSESVPVDTPCVMFYATLTAWGPSLVLMHQLLLEDFADNPEGSLKVFFSFVS
jgi:hypothetical protein